MAQVELLPEVQCNRHGEFGGPPARGARPGSAPARDDLPFLESISWFDRRYRDLSLLDMLRRYESGWRYLHALAEPSPEEWRFIRRLVECYGSTLHVPA